MSIPTRLAVLLAIIFGPVRPAAAQGSAADYARAAAMREQVQGTVLNATIDEMWLDDDVLLLRLQSARDRWRFVRVDADTGAQDAPFDHTRIAADLTALLGRPIGPERLPFGRFRADGDNLLALVTPDLRVVRIAAGAIAGEMSVDDADGFFIEPTRGQRSRDAGGTTGLLFVNRHDAPVIIEWLGREGGARRYATVEPGARHRQHTYAGHLWRVSTADGNERGRYRAASRFGIIVIDGTAHGAGEDAAAPLPNVSPDGRIQAIIREHNVHVRDLVTNETVPLTTNGSGADRYVGPITWSGDSRGLVVMQERPAQTHTIRMIETAPADRVQPKVHSMQYLKPGDRIAHRRPRLFDVEALRPVPIAEDLFGTPWSITRFNWRSDSTAFSFLYNARGHQQLRVIEVDAATGAARVIIEETSETFVDYSQKTYLHHLDATGEFIWMSERSGWNHLYRVDADSGDFSPITSGPWVVRGVERVDAATGEIWFRAMGINEGEDPYHVHYGRVKLDGTGLTWLTEGDGMHELRYSPSGAYYVDRWSRVDLPPVHELRRAADGALVAELSRADWTPLLEGGWRPPERFIAKGRDGDTDIWGVIFTPSTLDPDGRFPIIENIYAGPHSHFVPKRFSAWHGSRAMAELGFVVVHIDGMGTNWRSKAFHDVCWRNLGDSGFPDRIAWLRAAANTRPFMDLSRVGIYGGSAGGQSALRGLLAHGDFYDAGVADCGCHDNRMDKMWWNEAWMGWPVGPHYAEQSNVTQAHRLEGDLLLIVGELDRNVDPASTMQVVKALIEADKDFELLVMPGVGHGAAETPYGRRRRADFFVRTLLDREPRWTDETTSRRKR